MGNDIEIGFKGRFQEAGQRILGIVVLFFLSIRRFASEDSAVVLLAFIVS